MMLDQKNNEHTEERDGLWRKNSFDAFREIKWRGNLMA